MASPAIGTVAVPVKKAPRSSLLRSCERCRRRKIKCDDYFPCTACTRLGLQCKIGDDRKAEKSQRSEQSRSGKHSSAQIADSSSYLEERVRRLESLLAQQESRNGSDTHPVLVSPSSTLAGSGASQGLRLQIPVSPAMSPAPEDILSSPGRGFQDYQTAYASSFCSLPSDMANSPAGDHPPWSNEAFNFFDQASFFDYPRRTRSFPITPGTDSYSNVATDFSSMQPDNSFLLPDIPTIEVTSWETHSRREVNEDMMQDIDFNLPDLSIGSCSGPPSPSLTAPSCGYGNDEYVSEVHLDLPSRRSYIAFSEQHMHGSDSLKPAASRVLNFTYTRPRSRSDVLPHSVRYLGGTSSKISADTQYQGHSARSSQMPSQIIPGADETGYSQTFFDQVHTYFPVFSPQTIPALATTSNVASERYTNLQKFKMLLVLAIGSQYLNNIGACLSTVPDLYFQMAQKFYPANAWQQNPSLSVMQAHLLLAIYTLLATYSPPTNGNTQGSTSDAKPNLWMLNALITASAIDLNLHDRPDLDDKEQNPFVSVYVLDKVTGMLLGKPNLLSGLHIDLGGMRRMQGAIESRRMRADELANEDVGIGWRCVLEWYRTNGQKFVA
ncbi:uncharacterized protein RAG0_07076 [Rhynchosporium agropyri]|uniref:Zn(2)-C6 fungal-type domain-containing protein n=1 Tax=Rhynchosporium agropyri TaxID=914238 RepID=A0A1E1KJS7_9HELO|nr:uncharacterized protein RAG0_07076 [Rhynchosporium agropyri]